MNRGRPRFAAADSVLVGTMSSDTLRRRLGQTAAELRSLSGGFSSGVTCAVAHRLTGASIVGLTPPPSPPPVLAGLGVPPTLSDPPFDRLTHRQEHTHVAADLWCTTLFGVDSGPFVPSPNPHPATEDVTAARAVETAVGWSRRLGQTLALLPESLLTRLGLDPLTPTPWVMAVAHLGLHFPDHGLGVVRRRAVTGPAGRPHWVAEHTLPPGVAAGAEDPPTAAPGVFDRVFPGSDRVAPDHPSHLGVVVDCLADHTDFFSASAAGIQLLMEALENPADGPTPHPSFEQLSSEFAALSAHLSGRTESLRTRLIWARGAAMFSPLPARGLDGRTAHPTRRYVLSRLRAEQVLSELAGPAAEWFAGLADRAGGLLPRWPTRAYSDLRRGMAGRLPTRGAGDWDVPREGENEYEALVRTTRAVLYGEAGLGTPQLGLPPLVTDQRGNTERWFGLLLDFILQGGSDWSRAQTERGSDGAVALSFPGEWLAVASTDMIDQLGLVPARPGSGPPPTPRLRCDESDRSVHLDGKRVTQGLEPDAFNFFRAVAAPHPDPITFRKIQDSTKGLKGKNLTRLKAKLFPPLCDWLRSGGQGFYLELPRVDRK